MPTLTPQPAINGTVPPVVPQGATPAPTATRSLSDPSSSGNDLFNNLQSSYESSPTYTGILDRYNQAAGAQTGLYKQNNSYINNEYGQNITQQQQQNQYGITAAQEGQRGFATSPAYLNNLQSQADQRVKNLRDQMNEALMSNNTQGAAALSDLMVKEQSAITDARTNFLNQYFGSQSEARNEAQFPLTQNLTQAQTQEAQAAALAAPLQARAALASAGAAQTAAAGSSAANYAQAGQTRYLTSLYQGGGNNTSDVAGLLNGTLTPQQLQDKYSSIPSGGLIASQILNEAQQKGYNINAGTLTGLAQQRQVEAQNSGNPLTMFGSWLSGTGQTALRALSTPSGNTSPSMIRVAKPDGTTGTIPASSLPAALANGYKQL